jgi:hypothetical protein
MRLIANLDSKIPFTKRHIFSVDYLSELDYKNSLKQTAKPKGKNKCGFPNMGSIIALFLNIS